MIVGVVGGLAVDHAGSPMIGIDGAGWSSAALLYGLGVACFQTSE